MANTGSDYVIGVDVGTASARAGVFDARSGARLGLATHPIQIWRPEAEFAEQSSGDIWQAVGQVVREAVSEAGIDPAHVVGLGFDATCSLVVLGEGDHPLTVSPSRDPARNIIMWMDHRAVSEAETINRGGYRVLDFVGGGFSPEMEPPKLRWLKTHLPETWQSATKFLDLADFLTYRATGLDVRSLCTNVCKWGYRGDTMAWDKDFYNSIDLADVFERGRVTEAIRQVGERVGPLTNEAAIHLGLTTACAVAVGIIDAHAGGLGLMGAVEGDNLPSTLALISGTSNCHMAVSRDPHFIPGVWGPYAGAMVPNYWLAEGGQSAAGALIDATITRSPHHAALNEQAKAGNTTVYALLNAHLVALAAKAGLEDVALLARDTHVLDYHLGNRSPHADPHARGIADGLPLHPTLDDDAILYLATLQAVAYGTRAIVDRMNENGMVITTLTATGGGTKNALYVSTFADALGLPVTLNREGEAVLLGTAILAAHAAGVYPTVTTAMSALSHAGDTVSPQPATRRFHDAKYGIYRNLYTEQQARRALMQGILG